MYTAIIDKHPPISVVSLIFSFKNIFENIIVISGTTNINELAFTAPIFDDAKKIHSVCESHHHNGKYQNIYPKYPIIINGNTDARPITN